MKTSPHLVHDDIHDVQLGNTCLFKKGKKKKKRTKTTVHI